VARESAGAILVLEPESEARPSGNNFEINQGSKKIYMIKDGYAQAAIKLLGVVLEHKSDKRSWGYGNTSKGSDKLMINSLNPISTIADMKFDPVDHRSKPESL
jgi:hypothetical protein